MRSTYCFEDAGSYYIGDCMLYICDFFSAIFDCCLFQLDALFWSSGHDSRVRTRNFTRRAYRSRTVRVGLPVYTLRPLRRVRPVHSDHIRRRSQWTRKVRVGLALQCECSSGRVGYGSDAPSAHVCRLTSFFPLH